RDMRIYLDACSLQRPLDDRGQPRIHVEAEAVLTARLLIIFARGGRTLKVQQRCSQPMLVPSPVQSR
ncbi:MAG TPA: hypothetical protein VFA18_08525, partial [Gemmataceae bacterium]|nr:hypothetical protein [Gemmataceae bacterium]